MLANNEFESCSYSSEFTGVGTRGVARTVPPAPVRYSPYASHWQQKRCGCVKQQTDTLLGKEQQQLQEQQQQQKPYDFVASVRHQPPRVLARVALQLSERSINHTLDALKRATDTMCAATDPSALVAAPNAQVQEAALAEAEAAMVRTIKRLTIARTLATAALMRELDASGTRSAATASAHPATHAACLQQPQQQGLAAATEMRSLLQLHLEKLQRLLKLQQQQGLAPGAGAVQRVLPVLQGAEDDEGEAEVSSCLRPTPVV